MNTQLNTPQPIETRFNVNLAVLNFLDMDRVDFELFRPEMDPDEVDRIIASSGFNPNHPEFRSLVNQVKHTFSLGEIGQFIECLSQLEVVEIRIWVALYKVNDPTFPEKNVRTFRLARNFKSYDFSELADYPLPFVILGNYNPS